MIDILFDQFQRYNNVTNIINKLRKSDQVFNILEVGANEHQNLERFLPDDQITYLDIFLPEKLKNNPKYILGDATSMEFPENHYDIVVALDVFEHIAEEDRTKFISELYRVSSDFFIITAPFHSTKVFEAEKRVNAVYKSIFNKDFIWLEEHMTNGLPDLDKLSKYLDLKDMEYKIISHGDVEIWERMMAIHFITAQNPNLTVYRQQIDRFYNQHIYDIDYINDSYRKICVVAKAYGLSELTKANSTGSQCQDKDEIMNKLAALERTFYNLASLNTETILDESKDDSIQVFWDNGEGFDEMNSIREKVVSDTCHFEKKVDLELLKSIRIDPSNFKGAFRFNEISITEENGERIPDEKYSLIGNYNFEYNKLFVFYNDDPFVIINFSNELNVTNIRLSITKINDDEFKVSMIDNLTNVMKKLIENQETHHQELSLYKEEVLSYIKNIAELSQYNAELSKKNEDLIHKDNDLLIQLEELNLLVEELNELNNETKSENERLSQDILNYKKQLEEKSKELQEIYGSRSWRYVTKFRKIMGK